MRSFNLHLTKLSSNFYLLIFILLVISNAARGQNKQSFICGFNSSTTPDFCDFISENRHVNQNEVLNKVNSITDIVGLPPNFVLVECSNISNAYSYLSATGIRYIIIDSRWINTIESNDWLTLGVLAHEIGHHLCGHTSVNTVSTIEDSHKQELEADKFQGFILKGLGANQEQALLALNTLVPYEMDDSYKTHPTKSKRINAIKDGYNSQGTNSVLELTKDAPSAEKYYNLAVKTAPNPNLNTDDAFLLKAMDYYLDALTINPNFISALLNSGAIWQILGAKKSVDSIQSWETAMKCYLRVLSLDRENVGALNNLGHLYSIAAFEDNDQEYYKLAIDCLNKCIQLKPNFGGAYLNRGIAYLNYGYAFNLLTMQQACSDFSEACSLGQTNGCTYFKKACQ